METGDPAAIHLAVEPIWTLVRDSGKAVHVQTAALNYTAAHGKTWPSADPSNYTMGWCDCYADMAQPPNSGVPPDHEVAWMGCSRTGYVSVAGSYLQGSSGVWYTTPWAWCCRPCFTVPQ